MTKGKNRFYQGVWQSLHNGKKAPHLTPAIRTTYDRITLVSKNGEERLTIDFNVKTKDLRKEDSKVVELKNLVIIESKTLKKDALALVVMKKHNIAKAKACSKYSLGVVYAGLATKYDHFTNTMERIKEIRLETLASRTREQSIKSFSGTKQFTRKPIKSAVLKK